MTQDQTNSQQKSGSKQPRVISPKKVKQNEKRRLRRALKEDAQERDRQRRNLDAIEEHLNAHLPLLHMDDARRAAIRVLKTSAVAELSRFLETLTPLSGIPDGLVEHITSMIDEIEETIDMLDRIPGADATLLANLRQLRAFKARTDPSISDVSSPDAPGVAA